MGKRDLGKVLVTGADGFIGSHLTERLVALGIETTALCIYNSEGSCGWLSHCSRKNPKNLKIVLGDIRDPFQMQEVCKGIDTVFHLAALIAIPYSYVAPHSYAETNILGTLNLLEAARKAEVGRFVQTSTSEVYGTALFVPITEEHPQQGQSPYSATKIGADALVDSFWRSFAFPAVTLRPFNTFGPRQSNRAVIPTVIAQVLSGTKKIQLGSLHPTRDFNFVSNTVEAFVALAEADSFVLGQTFNAGSGREISVGDMVRLVCCLANAAVEIYEDPIRLRPEKSEVERLLADATRLTTATGWLPKISLEDGLISTIEWHKDHSDFVAAQRYQR
jgi:UDP-glucose 4-epimerase